MVKIMMEISPRKSNLIIPGFVLLCDLGINDFLLLESNLQI